MADPKLIVEEEGVEVPVEGDVLIGRLPEAAIRVPPNDFMISRKHAVVEREGDLCYVRHIGSNANTTQLNGSWVGKERIQLHPGDIIQVGSTLIRFVDMAAAAQPSDQGGLEVGEFKEVAGGRDLGTDSQLFRAALLQKEADAVTADRIQALFKATVELDPFLGEAALYQKAMDILKDVLGLDPDINRSVILTRSPSDGKVQPRASYPKAWQGDLPISWRVINQVMNGEGKALLSKDVHSDRAWAHAKTMLAYNIRSVMCVPIRTDKDVIGSWYVDMVSIPRFYSEHDLAFLGSLANFLARSILSARLMKEAEERAIFINNIERYFSHNVVHELQGSTANLLEGKEARVCVMFTDVRKFSKISMQLAPRDLLHLLNEHFSYIVDIILDFEGTIDKYIGDSVMAFWGAPVSVELASVRCVQAAILIQKEMHLFRKKMEVEARIPIDIGIGINTGLAIAGNIGSVRRMDYSIMSDAVNLSERLCEMASPGQILIGPETYKEVKHHFGLDHLRKLPPREAENMGMVVPYEVLY